MTDPYGTIRAQILDLQGNSSSGQPSNNDWRLIVEAEQLRFQHFDSSSGSNGAYITRQSFGTGLTGITVAPQGTYSINGNLQVTDDLTVDGGSLFVDSSTNRVGFGTLTPSTSVHIVGNTYVDGNLTVTGTASISSSSIWTKTGGDEVYYTGANVGIGTNNPEAQLDVHGTSKFTGNMTMEGHIIPDEDNKYDLGSATNTFRHVYVGPGSLYVNGKQVVTDDSGTITISTDIHQNLSLKTSGSGSVQINAVGDGDLEFGAAGGIIQMKKTLQILDGQKITSSGSTTVVCGNNFKAEGSLRGTTLTLDGVNTINSTELNVLDGVTPGTVAASKAVVADANKDVSGFRNVTVTGDLTVSGTTTTVNSTTVSVADSLFQYASTNIGDIVDIGWYGKYVDSGVTRYSGMFRDASDGTINIFTGTQNAPGTTVDLGGTDYTKGDLVVGEINFTSAAMKGHIIPDTNDAYDIGSAEFKIRDMYVSENSLWIGDEHKVTISGGKMKFRKRKTNVVPAAILAAGGTEPGAKAFANNALNLVNIKLKDWRNYLRQLTGDNTKKVRDVFRATSDDYDEEQGANSWLESGNNIYLGASGNVGIGDSIPSHKLDVNGTGRFTGNLTCDATIIGNVTGNAATATTAGTVTMSDQPAITSVGTLTSLQVGNININGNTISSTAGTDLNITPNADKQIVLDGTILIDAGVVTGATSITSTSFVGDLTGDVTGNAATATTAGTVTMSDQPAITSVGTLTSLIVSGDLTIGGSTTTINTSTITVDDPLIRLSDNNTGNLVDTGFYCKYVSNGTKFRGLVHDVSDSIWKLFETITSNAEPITTVDVASYGNLKLANLEATSITSTTSLQVDTININGNTISSTAGTDLNITPNADKQIVLDGTILIDAGVVTGATSITSTSFVGDLTGTVITPAQTNISSVGTLTSLTVGSDNTTTVMTEVLRMSGKFNGSGGCGAEMSFSNYHNGATNGEDYLLAQIRAYDQSYGWDGALAFLTVPRADSSLPGAAVGGGTPQTRMTITANGFVGIGNTAPNYPLLINGSGGSTYDRLYAYHHATYDWSHWNSVYWTQSSSDPVSLKVEHGIIASSMFFFSDSRIKKDIVDVSDDQALIKLRQLQPKKYKYKNLRINGDQEVYGFIAQEVKTVIPSSVTLKEDYVPDMMVSAQISSIEVNGNAFIGDNGLQMFTDTCILTTQADHQLQVNDVISCRDSKYKKIDNIKVLEVIDSKTFKIDKIFTAEQSTFEDENGFQEQNVIFIYGKKVNDFHNLNKNAIWTIATAALQEVDRQLQAEKAKVAILETELAAIKTHLGL